MRTIGGGNSAQPTSGFGPGAITAVKVEVANASDVLTDLSQYVVSLEYEQSVDEIVDAATVVFRRKEGASSLAPLMTASPPINIGRRIVISINPGSGTYKEIFRGKIDDVDWPERDGVVTVQCRDQAGTAADTWIETARSYSTTGGVSLETVMQAVADDNLTTSYTLNFPVATSAVVLHVDPDKPYGPTDQSVLEALRTLAESIGWTIRWRHFDASASDWKWTVFQPSRTKTTPDHTFATTAYWDVRTMRQELADIRNVVEVVYVENGVQKSVTVSDSSSITKYGRRYMKIVEGSGSPINNSTRATSLGNAALSDLKEPNALLEIECRYFWPGEVGVDLYRFTANNKHFSSDQDLAAMGFRHRIAVGERPTTWILTRGKPSGGVLMWQQRSKATTTEPEMSIGDFRETARSDTEATFGWTVRGNVRELWLYTSTPSQPVATDPWAALTGVPTVRLTAATTSYTIPVPNPGLVTYGRLVAIGPNAARSKAWDFTVQGESVRLIQRADITTTTATTCTVVVKVANPIAGTTVTVTPAAVGCTISPTGAQTIAAGSVTTDIETTGSVTYTVTRPASLSGTGRVTFTATSTDRAPDIDAVDIPAQERDLSVTKVTAGEVSSESLLGLSHDLVFSASDNDTVAWTSGTITFSNGSSFSISAGNTGNITALTYIYLDPAVSATVLQTTTTASTAVGQRKVLVATAKNVSDTAKLAEFTVFGGAGGAGQTITTNRIAANAITANEINAGAVTAAKINVTSLSAIVAEVGSLVLTNGTSTITFKHSDGGEIGKLGPYFFSSGGDTYYGLYLQARYKGSSTTRDLVWSVDSFDAAELTVNGSVRIVNNVGFYNTAPGSKPTVTGSRGGNAALASLLTGLAGLGLLTDSSTA